MKLVKFQEEEEERLGKWKEFLVQQEESGRASRSNEDNTEPVVSEVTEQSRDSDQAPSEKRDASAEQCTAVSGVPTVEKVSEGDGNSSEKPSEGSVPPKEAPSNQHGKPRQVKTWADISPSLNQIDKLMSLRIKKKSNVKHQDIRCENRDLPSIDEAGGGSEDENEATDSTNAPTVENSSPELGFPWKEELASLVRGGVPKDLRGEVASFPGSKSMVLQVTFQLLSFFTFSHMIGQVWQAFVGVRTRRVERYYQDLLAVERDASDDQEHDKSACEGKKADLPEKLKKQIEKVVSCMAPQSF